VTLVCVINHEQKTCLLIEIAVPFDAFVNEVYQTKFNRYLPLCQRVNDMGYYFRTVVLVVGSLGSAHMKFVSGLKLCDVPVSMARSVAKYCSISTMTDQN